MRTGPGNGAGHSGVESLLVVPQMEDAMCYSRDYKLFEDQQKKADAQLRRERQSGVLDTMLNGLNKQAEEAKEATPIKDVAPAK
jgi:hypothetical protein